MLVDFQALVNYNKILLSFVGLEIGISMVKDQKPF